MPIDVYFLTIVTIIKNLNDTYRMTVVFISKQLYDYPSNKYRILKKK